MVHPSLTSENATKADNGSSSVKYDEKQVKGNTRLLRTRQITKEELGAIQLVQLEGKKASKRGKKKGKKRVGNF